MRHLMLTLEAPLMAFGGETIDAYGAVRWFPAASMLTGLFGNALGWRREEHERHQRLQDRLLFAARIDREPAGNSRMTDFQTARLRADDRGWTTRGVPEGRGGAPGTYNAPHLRYRDYYADMRVAVALRLEPGSETPALEALAAALQEPARPLFIGRKPCLPTVPLFAGFGAGDTCLAALLAWPLGGGPVGTSSYPENRRVLWPEGEGSESVTASRSYPLTDQRNWRTGLHGGARIVCEGAVPHGVFGATAAPGSQ